YYLGGEIQDRAKLIVAKPDLFRQRFNIDLRTRHEALAIDRPRKSVKVLDRDANQTYELAYDRLILAPGAAPIVPPIPGTDAANVFTLRNLEDTDRIKHYLDTAKPSRAVVVGAGFIGLEMVEQLADRGINVSLVELTDQVMPLLDPEMAHLLEEELAAHKVDLHLGDGIVGFQTQGDRATAVTLASGKAIATDLVILGIGVRPNTKLAEAAGLELGPSKGIKVNPLSQTSDPTIYAVGDAAEYIYGPTDQPLRVPLAGPANRAGRLAGEHAATGRSAPMGKVWGTSIVRVFGKTAAMTGLTEKLAKRLGRAVKSVIIQANHHAGYYPGAQPMVLKLLYVPGTGKVLGAQAVGGEGVDKRIDVIATLLHFGGTVWDLTNLDLAYAPPFGAAKDPVHMAGFAATNELAGLVEHLPPGCSLAGQQVVDLRTAAEHAASPLAGTDDAVVKHIPIDELRGRIGELDPSKPTVLHCASGLRSYIGTRILRQHGFTDVKNLTGGAIMRRHAVFSAGLVKP
ncbi:MAG: FAD-dependent oxidoreductase, partial [Phycisphaeraceae bacterium]|nr:FAD-dependent oxidoreductase [Phycisphaeraceae bacterium]